MIRKIDPRGPNVTWKAAEPTSLSGEESDLWTSLGWAPCDWGALFRPGKRSLWNESSVSARERLTKLGFTEQSWNDPSFEYPTTSDIRPLLPEGVHKTWNVVWDDLSVTERHLWADVGWNSHLWETHHPSHAWDRIMSWGNIKKSSQEHLRKLHYTENTWCQPTIVATAEVLNRAAEKLEQKKEEKATMSNEIKSVATSAIATVEATATKVAGKAKKRIRAGGRRAICREVVSTTQTGIVEVFTAIGMDSPTAMGLAEWMKTENGKALLGGGMGVAIECIPGDHPLADEVAVELQEEAISLVFAGPLAAAFNPIKKMIVNVFRLTGDTKAADQVEAMSGMADVLNPKAG